MGLSIKLEGLEDIEALLESMSPRDAKRFMAKATAEGAKYLKPRVKAETPWRAYRGAVQAGQAKRNRPAGIVKYNPKKAPFRHIMLGGSKDHSTKRVRAGKSDIQAFTDGGVAKFSRGHDVRGVKGDPVIDRVADRYGDDALRVTEEYLVRAFGLDE
jgi:hypothetical protein